MQNKPSQPSNKKPQFDSFLKYGNIAFTLFAAIFLGVWGGMKLDELINSKPWFTIILSLFGISAGIYAALKDFIRKK